MLDALPIGYTLVAAALFLGLSMSVLVIVSRRTLVQNNTMARRLATPPSERQKTRSFVSANLIEKFGKHIALPGPEEITKIRFKLAQAGYYNVQAVTIYYGFRVFALVAPQITLLTLWAFVLQNIAGPLLVKISLGLVVLGMLVPYFILRSKINKRRQLARDGFPDLLDLLISCLEAGLGLDAALSNIAKELGPRFPVLKINLDLLNLELMAGRKRYEAFKNFAERLGLEEAKSLTVMLKQSEEMGSSLGLALRTFSEEMRINRMLRAEEKAMALPAKMTIPLIVFIFPTIMTMLLLPAIARLAEVF